MFVPAANRPSFEEKGNKKTDVTEHAWVFGHIGLLINGPPAARFALF